MTVTFDWVAHPTVDGDPGGCVPRTSPTRTLVLTGIENGQGFDFESIYNGDHSDQGQEKMRLVKGASARRDVELSWRAADGETAPEISGDACAHRVFDLVVHQVAAAVRLGGLEPETSSPVPQLAQRSDGYELRIPYESRPDVQIATDQVQLDILVPSDGYRLHGIRTPLNATVETPDSPRPVLTSQGQLLRYSGEAASLVLEGDAVLILIDTRTSPDGILVTQSAPMRGLLFVAPLAALGLATYDTSRYIHRAGEGHRRRVIGYGAAIVLLTGTLAVSAIPAVVQDRLYELERGDPSLMLLLGLAGLVVVTLGSLLMTQHLRGTALVHLARERVQERAEQQKIAARSEELEGFVAGLGHDLQTPLIALDWLTKDVEEELLSGDPEEVRASIGRIRKNVGGMDRLVKDLLELTRIDKGEHNETAVDMRNVLEDVVATVEDDARRRGATLHVDRRSLPALKGDHALWRQVFQNLVGNAVKYGRQKDGNVYVRAMRLPDGGVRMEVEDDGPGIPDDEKITIFEMFRRGTTGVAQEGTGLGLALVRKIVEKYGGTVKVEGGDEGGSRFVVDVPASRVTSRTAEDIDPEVAHQTPDGRPSIA